MAADETNAEAPSVPASEASVSAAAAPSGDERAFPRGRTASTDASPLRAAIAPGAISMPGWFGWQFHLGVGVMALGAAAARAAVLAKTPRPDAPSGWAPPWLLGAGGVLLWGVALAGLGYVALRVLALWLRRPLGDSRLGAARMLTAVGLFELSRRIGWAPFGVSVLDWGFVFSLSLGAYLGAVACTFRLKRDDLLLLLGAHAGMGAIAHVLVAMIAGAITSPAPADRAATPASRPPVTQPRVEPPPKSEPEAPRPASESPGATAPSAEPAPSPVTRQPQR